MTDMKFNDNDRAVNNAAPDNNYYVIGQTSTNPGEVARSIGLVEDSEPKKEKDRRVRKTKNAIHKAFLELLEEKSFSDITIIELTERADVNRKTFYNHYPSIEAVLDEMEDEVALQMMEQIRREVLELDSDKPMTVEEIRKFVAENAVSYFSSIIGSVKKNPVYVKLLNDPAIEAGFLHKLVQQDMEVFRKLLKNCNSKDFMWAEYFLKFCVNGAMAVIRDWAKAGCKTPPEELAGFLSTLLARE